MNSTHPIPSLETVAESDVDPALDAQIREFLLEYFPNWADVFKTRRTWHDAPPVFTTLARCEGKIVGHVAVVERTITTRWNWRYLAASIQGVAVARDFRKTGLSTKILDLALQEAADAGYKFAILFCREPLRPFYERNGWKLPNDSMIMWRDRELPIHMQSNCPMCRELSDEPFPEGELDVHNPF
ncbi:MAG: GNAT family N-acetyltransferase [Thermoguttaceae bacterium]|nr:GNAT family N-acetyltransferase [Thermoguttaceae bacterium]